MGLFNFLAPLAGPIIGAFANKKAKPATSQSQSGWQTLPPEVQQAYLKSFLPAINDWYNSENPLLDKTLGSLGGGIESLQKELPSYMNPYANAVTEDVVKQIRNDSDMARNKLFSQAAGSGLGGSYSTAFGNQLAQLENDTLNRIGRYRNYSQDQNYRQAVGLRNQTLASMLSAANRPYEEVQQYGSLLGMFPGGSTQTSTGPRGPDPLLNALGGTLGYLGSVGNSNNFLPF